MTRSKKQSPKVAETQVEAQAEVQQEVQSEVEQEAQQEAQAVQLQIADLQSLARIVDIASRRGAFEASEMQFVGTVYNKLSAFLNYVTQARKTETETKTQSAETEQ